MERLDFGCAVVTGAASGIGRALAVRLAEAGTRLVLADVRAEPLAAVAAEITATAPTDVSDLAAVGALAAAAPDADLVCMSEIGDDPLDVADAALAATRRGEFAVTPREWHAGVVRRAERLVASQQPTSASPG